MSDWEVEMSVIVKARTAQEAEETLRAWCLINEPPGHLAWCIAGVGPADPQALADALS